MIFYFSTARWNIGTAGYIGAKKLADKKRGGRAGNTALRVSGLPHGIFSVVRILVHMLLILATTKHDWTRDEWRFTQPQLYMHIDIR